MRKGVLYSCILVCVFVHILFLATLPVKCADLDGFTPVSDTFETSIFQDSLTVEGLTTANEPSLSAVDEGRIYYNSDDDTFKASLSNGAYLDLVFNDGLGDGDWTRVGSDIFSAVSGNVGIGVNPPISKFQVENGSVLFNGTTGAIPVTGAGTRMMWVPSSASFRAGNVTGTQWDILGAGSVGLGADTTATGAGSVAIAQDSSATANFATAIGFTSSASNLGSTAVGPFADASGSTSSSFSFGGQASGDFAVTLGTIPGLPAPFGTTPLFVASGTNSMAISNGFVNSVADSSIIIGRGVDASNFLTNTAVTDEQSISFGMNSTIPTLYISNSGGVGLTGNVGIGNSTPSTKVDISGAATIREIAAPALAPANQGRIYFDATDDRMKISNNTGAYSDIGQVAVIQVFDSDGNNGSNLDLNQAGVTAIPWDSVTAGAADSIYGFTGVDATPSTVVTVNRTGMYKVTYAVHTESSGGRRNVHCRVLINGSTPVGLAGDTYTYSRNATDEFATNTTSFLISINSGQTVGVGCNGEGSAGISVLQDGTVSDESESWMMIELIR